MKLRYILYLVFLVFLPLWLCAQCPQRTAEEEADKMTEMLCRDLGDVSPEQRDSIHLFHLECARERMQHPHQRPDSVTMQKHLETLRGLLTPEQWERFINRPMGRPRRGGGEPNMPSTPPDHRP